MKAIRVPEPVFVPINGQEKEFTFTTFIQNTVLVDGRFGKSVKELRLALVLSKGVEQVRPRGLWLVEDAPYELLRAATLEPASGYNPLIAVHLLPFIDAIEKAVDTPATAVQLPASAE